MLIPIRSPRAGGTSRIAIMLASILAAIELGSLAAPARATTIDGRRDADYGAALSTQTTQTSFGDTPPEFTPADSLNVCYGSELDGAFASIAGGTLYLFFAGNLQSYFGEPLTNADHLEIFVDCAAGGQNVLRADNPNVGENLTLAQLAGLTFDAAFAADYWFDFTPGGSGHPHSAYSAVLPAGGGGAGGLLGHTFGGPPGVLSGGSNPFGIRATIVESNRFGVTGGCGASSGDGVSTGIEWAIPLAALGNPSQPIRISVFVDGTHSPPVSNQVLGPVPPGTCSLGSPSSVDFGSIPGNQFFTVGSIAGVGAATATTFLRPSLPNPFATRTMIEFSVARRARVTLGIYDVSGRRVRHLMSGVVEPGAHSAEWNGRDDRGARLEAGLYFCRFDAGETRAVQRMVLVR